MTLQDYMDFLECQRGMAQVIQEEGAACYARATYFVKHGFDRYHLFLLAIRDLQWQGWDIRCLDRAHRSTNGDVPPEWIAHWAVVPVEDPVIGYVMQIGPYLNLQTEDGKQIKSIGHGPTEADAWNMALIRMRMSPEVTIGPR